MKLLSLNVFAAVLFLVGSMPSNVSASIVYADTADATAINTGDTPNSTSGTPLNLFVVDSTSTSIRSGRYDDGATAINGSNAAAVMPFLLPDFGAVSNPFTSATFTFQLEAATNSNQNHTLYGLPSRDAATVLAEDFHFGGTSGSTTETSLQGNILVGRGNSAAGSYTSNDISSFLNTQYANGANAGKFVFLRIAPNGGNTAIFNNITNGARITSADAASNRPFIDYESAFTAIPEPASIATFGMGLMGLCLQRRRTRRS